MKCQTAEIWIPELPTTACVSIQHVSVNWDFIWKSWAVSASPHRPLGSNFPKEILCSSSGKLNTLKHAWEIEEQASCRVLNIFPIFRFAEKSWAVRVAQTAYQREFGQPLMFPHHYSNTREQKYDAGRFPGRSAAYIKNHNFRLKSWADCIASELVCETKSYRFLPSIVCAVKI